MSPMPPTLEYGRPAVSSFSRERLISLVVFIGSSILSGVAYVNLDELKPAPFVLIVSSIWTVFSGVNFVVAGRSQ